MGVAEEVFEFVDAAAVFEVGGGEAVTEGVDGDAFAEAGAMGGFFEGFGKGVLMEVMATDDAGFGIA